MDRPSRPGKPLSGSGDHMRLHSGTDRSRTEARSDGGRGSIGGGVQPSGVPSLDLVAQRCPLAETNDRVAGGNGAAEELDRFSLE
jgi:hypothetical protein